MQQGKLVKKSLVDNILAIGKNESWLSHMAKKGLILKGYEDNKMHFIKGEPKDKKYRIIILNSETAESSKLLYLNYGWEFVDNCEVYYIFCTDAQARHSEIRLDQQTRSYAIKHINKYLTKLIIKFAKKVLFALLSWIFILFKHGMILPFVIFPTSLGIIFSYLIAIALYDFIKSYTIAVQLKKTILEYRQIEHVNKFRLSRRMSNINLIILLLLGIYCLSTFYVDLGAEKYTLDEAEKILPILRLADVEGDSPIILDEHFGLAYIDLFGEENTDYNNVECSNTLLAHIMYDSDENGILLDDIESNDDYAPSIKVEYYELRSRLLAEPLAKDIINKHIYDFTMEDAVELHNANVDKVYQFGEEYYRHFIICDDNKVVHINYYGNQSSEKIIQQAIDKLM